MMKKILLFTLVVCSLSVYAVENKNSGWLGTFAKKSLTEKYSYWIETQVRYGFDKGRTNQVLYRTGFLQKISSKQGLGYLYGHISGVTSKEHRLTLQHTMKYGKLSHYKFSHRARLEGRFLEDTSQDAGRVRYLLRAEEDLSNEVGFVFWNEVFINTNETRWNGTQSFDRNRLFVGIKNPFFTKNRIEVGYLNQFVPRKSKDTSEHVMVFYMFF